MSKPSDDRHSEQHSEQRLLDIKSLAACIDHTYLKPDAGSAEILKLCQEAMAHHFYSVCVNSCWVSFCKKALEGSPVCISTVCGFPLGASSSEVKAFEAAYAVEKGASEIDMVLPVGLLMEGNYSAVLTDISRVVDSVRGGAIVKVILETCLLSDEQKKMGCQLSEQAGAHFVKTSTGFSTGGATVADVRLMREAVSHKTGVKASGGIKDLQTALQMIEAGANRLGTSSGVAILNGTKGTAAGY